MFLNLNFAPWSLLNGFKKTSLRFSLDLIAHIQDILTSTAFLERNRQSKSDFTRQRALPFVTVVLFLLNFVKRSLQDELDTFFSQLQGRRIPTRTVTKSAFTQARQKLKYQAFCELTQAKTQYFYDHIDYQTWHGFRLLAVDGSTVQLPNVTAIADHFGQWHPAQGDPCPVGRLSQMYDPLNQITCHALIAPKAQGERELASQHIQAVLKPNDLTLLDRGYPAFWLFVLILLKGGQFCARMPLGLWKLVDTFVSSGQQETIVELTPTYAAIKECDHRNLPTASIQIRLLRIELDNGEIEVLATSLVDSKAYPYHLFKELYHSRWPVEERYKTMKCRIEIENFSGKSVTSVYQDFHARVFTMNLAGILTQPAQDIVEKNNREKKLDYKINLTQLLSKMKYTICLLFDKSKGIIRQIIKELIQITADTVEPVRPGRSYPRKHKGRPKKYHMNYKPIR